MWIYFRVVDLLTHRTVWIWTRSSWGQGSGRSFSSASPSRSSSRYPPAPSPADHAPTAWTQRGGGLHGIVLQLRIPAENPNRRRSTGIAALPISVTSADMLQRTWCWNGFMPSTREGLLSWRPLKSLSPRSTHRFQLSVAACRHESKRNNFNWTCFIFQCGCEHI